MQRKTLLILGVIVALLLIGYYTVRKFNPAKLIEQWSDTVNKWSSGTTIPAVRVLAHIEQESSGNPNVPDSPNGARGLMQIRQVALDDVNNVYGYSFTFDDLKNPDTNILVGTLYLQRLKRYFSGDLDKATQAYFAGIGNVKKNPEAGKDYLTSVQQIESKIIQQFATQKGNRIS